VNSNLTWLKEAEGKTFYTLSKTHQRVYVIEKADSED